MELSDRAAEAWFQRKVHNVANCLPVLCFSSSRKKGKVLIAPKKENPYFIRCSLYLYAHIAQKWENMNYLRCSITNRICFPSLRSVSTGETWSRYQKKKIITLVLMALCLKWSCYSHRGTSPLPLVLRDVTQLIPLTSVSHHLLMGPNSDLWQGSVFQTPVLVPWRLMQT